MSGTTTSRHSKETPASTMIVTSARRVDFFPRCQKPNARQRAGRAGQGFGVAAAPAEPPREEKRAPSFGGVRLKHLVCGLLVLQNTGAAAHAVYASMPGEGQYITQTAVIMQEVMKGLACVVLLLKDEGTLASAWEKPSEALKTSVPALLYLVQNNLQYVAVGYLDAATYTVSYQSKIIWSGMLSVLLLGRKLGAHKWLGIVLLGAGVATVQLAGQSDARGRPRATAVSGKAVGLVAIILAAMVSALAGVYFEKILKGAKGAALRAGHTSFFFGYTKMTWVCVTMNAFGASSWAASSSTRASVMKDVALGTSIVCSSLLSVYLFDFEINALFAGGIAVVIYSAPAAADVESPSKGAGKPQARAGCFWPAGRRAGPPKFRPPQAPR
ncbi:UDP-N-acetylglucosamine transmembrane transporter [Aureococcus anophagefferens]|uniref:UDP-N-acetylglucosamine transmembrane transporter n=1 Tax=Aureococcus anophagefferens TaxID=44056 RepID=A0ABR1GFZ3_AURAN